VGRPPQKAGLVGFGNRGETGNNRLAGNERTLPVARRRRIRRFARLCVAYFPTTGAQTGRTPPLRPDGHKPQKRVPLLSRARIDEG
jgi:hypothetical protein